MNQPIPTQSAREALADARRIIVYNVSKGVAATEFMSGANGWFTITLPAGMLAHAPCFVRRARRLLFSLRGAAACDI
jgi:hypothetical protein